MNPRDEIIDWLRDACAMERGLLHALQKIADNENQLPEVRSAAATHLVETRNHERIVEDLLRSLGSRPSLVRTGLGLLTEGLKGVSTSMARDEVIKDLLAIYAMEHFEIASYGALIAAAEAAGFKQVAAACKTIIADDHEMAATISHFLPEVVQAHLTEERFERAVV